MRNIIRFTFTTALIGFSLNGTLRSLHAEEGSTTTPDEMNREPAQKKKKPAKHSAKKSPSKATPASSVATPKTSSTPGNDNAQATAVPNVSLESPAGKKVDFSAKDVWDVDIFKDPSNKVLVIQDRAYTKAGKVELGANLGMLASSPFYTSYSFGGHAAYHFSEYWGIDGYYAKIKSGLTPDGTQTQEFLTNSGFASTKEFQEPKTYFGLGVIWSPIYGKFAFFRRSIIHFDIFGTAGLSNLSTDSNVVSRGGRNQSSWGSLLGIGARVFFSKHWSMRFDVRNNIYSSYFAENKNNGTGAGVSVMRNSFQYTVGVSYMFKLLGE